MRFISKKHRNKHLISEAFKILMEGDLQLNQKEIVFELEKQGVQISTSAINRAYKRIDELGQPSLKLLGEALPRLVYKLTGYSFNDERNEFILEKNNENIGVSFSNMPLNREIKVYEEGRISLEEKLKFIQSAQKSVIEIGVSLRTLTTYFTSRSQFEYRLHIEEMLKKGIDFSFILIDRLSEVAKVYFEDRNESNRVPMIENVINDLKIIQKEYEAPIYKGQFNIFTYQHFPYHHSLLLDKDMPISRMLVSHYLPGLRRADCPVLEFSESGNPILFQTYLKSIQYTLEHSQPI